MLKEWLWRIPTAIAAAIYWYAVAWLCFAATGSDPIDIAFGTGTPFGRAMAIVVLAAAVAGFALAGRAIAARRRR
jgi:uncharacterized integral membrane protein